MSIFANLPKTVAKTLSIKQRHSTLKITSTALIAAFLWWSYKSASPGKFNLPLIYLVTVVPLSFCPFGIRCLHPKNMPLLAHPTFNTITSTNNKMKKKGNNNKQLPWNRNTALHRLMTLWILGFWIFSFLN